MDSDLRFDSVGVDWGLEHSVAGRSLDRSVICHCFLADETCALEVCCLQCMS